MTHFDPERLPRRFAALKQQKRAAFITFLTAGDPDFDSSLRLIQALPEAGADIIELGMPFSDPMADGPTIQRASKRALKAGMTLEKTLHIAEVLRQQHPETPIILMGYYNPIYRFGNQAFLNRVRDIGVDGLIIVDLPPEEDNEFAVDALEQNIHFIRLITPTSSQERIARIIRRASGFLYYVSITGITGTKEIALPVVTKHLEIIRQQTDLPIVVGFGIKHPEQATAVARIAEGVVVGSALVSALEKSINDGANELEITGVLKITNALSRAIRQAAKAE